MRINTLAWFLAGVIGSFSGQVASGLWVTKDDRACVGLMKDAMWEMNTFHPLTMYLRGSVDALQATKDGISNAAAIERTRQEIKAGTQQYERAKRECWRKAVTSP